MSNCCNTSSIECIKITSVTVGATEIELNETSVVLSTLPVGKRIELIIDPADLPESVLPVVLTDGITDIPLWQENGDTMLESTFLPFCRKLARWKDNAHVRMKYYGRPTHLYVYCMKRY